VKDVLARREFLSTPGSLENFFMLCSTVDKFDNLVSMLRTPECSDGKVMVFFATCACVDYFSSALKA
jgi:ATP-dependent RNA helicase DDX55/SPB4